MRAVLTVIGKDTVGIISKVSTFLYESNINILDISQTIMQDLFTMIMLVDLSETKEKIDVITSELEKLSSQVGVTIKMQHEDIFNSMHRI